MQAEIRSTWSVITVQHPNKGAFSKAAGSKALIISACQALMQPIQIHMQACDYWKHTQYQYLRPKYCHHN